MNAAEPVFRPDYRKYRLLREALVDVRALVPAAPEAPAKAPAGPAPLAGGHDEARARRPWNPGLRLDGLANLAVICAGVAIVVEAAVMAAGGAHPGAPEAANAPARAIVAAPAPGLAAPRLHLWRGGAGPDPRAAAA
jgi:hypothetical protein